jgi:hypothetical protein
MRARDPARRRRRRRRVPARHAGPLIPSRPSSTRWRWAPRMGSQVAHRHLAEGSSAPRRAPGVRSGQPAVCRRAPTRWWGAVGTDTVVTRSEDPAPVPAARVASTGSRGISEQRKWRPGPPCSRPGLRQNHRHRRPLTHRSPAVAWARLNRSISHHPDREDHQHDHGRQDQDPATATRRTTTS